MRPNDRVQPNDTCLSLMHVYKPWHRGTVVSFPDRYNGIRVKWDHKRSEVVMAGRYIEPAKDEALAD
jgi:hypothetical protein